MKKAEEKEKENLKTKTKTTTSRKRAALIARVSILFIPGSGYGGSFFLFFQVPSQFLFFFF